MDSITLDQAQQIARQRLAEIAPEHHFVILLGGTKELSFGWVFQYVPQRFAETHNPSDLVPGFGPLVVTHERTARFLPSSVPPDVAVENYRLQWEQSHPGP